MPPLSKRLDPAGLDPETFDPAAYDAFLFDLDGVITPTVEVHRLAWHETFDEVFSSLGLAPYQPGEYFESLDGRPRFEGVTALLAARGVELPLGTLADDGLQTVRGIGNRKNGAFTRVLHRDGIVAYPGSLRFLARVEAEGIPMAIVSSSQNAQPVLHAAGLLDRFPVIVDGLLAGAEGLPGKPAPDTFLRAAELLGAEVARTAVVEDAASGVEAGRRGGFGCVIGIDRGAGNAALMEAGADIVVCDLEELL